MNKSLIILGSTSTGKTDLALSLAKKFNGELVSVDSRQVYIGLDIGTGKMPNGRLTIDNGQLKKRQGYWKINGINIWMYDVINPKKQYTVYDYVKDAEEIINKIQTKNKLPIIVGGTGLYLKGLLYSFPNLGIPIDNKLRKSLEKLSLGQLQNKIQQLSFDRWEKMNYSDRQNPRRLIRAIEIVILSVAKDLPRRWDSNELRDSSLIVHNDILKIGLSAPRDILYQRIDERVINRINQGMVEEAKDLHKNGLSLKRMRQLGLEYGVLADYLEKKITNEELIKILQRKIHSYAKRQVTWFKKEKDINWFDITEKKYISKVENLISKWYYQSDAS